jgi:hypothetical protein
MPILVDEAAKQIALRNWTLAPVPPRSDAAVNEAAISGRLKGFDGGSSNRALLVTEPKMVEIRPLFPISDHANAGIVPASQRPDNAL